MRHPLRTPSAPARMAAALAGIAILLGVAGCSAPAGTGPDPSTTPAAPISSSVPSSADPSSDSSEPAESSAASDPSDPDAPPGQCADDSIGTQVLPTDSGAGNRYYQLVFTNLGTTDCELRGYPGLSVVADGTQLGAAAERFEGMQIAVYPLEPGDSIGAAVRVVNIEPDGGPLGDACDVASGDGWRIYPPHSTTAVFVESPGLPACLSPDVSWLRVGALRRVTFPTFRLDTYEIA